MSAAMIAVRPDLEVLSDSEIMPAEVVSSASEVRFDDVRIDGGDSGARVATRSAPTAHYWLNGGDIVQPLSALVTWLENGVLVAEEPRSGIHGVGSDFASAIGDLRAALVEHRDVLEGASQLSDDLADQLTLLRRHLRR